MRWHVLIVVVLSGVGRAGVSPPVIDGTVPIPELVAKSSFVCKGRVETAPVVKGIGGPLPRMTGLATIKLDRCFKGRLEDRVTVAADEYYPAAGWGGGGGIFTPEIGEYLLLFLKKRKSEVYEIADWRGALPVSTQTSPKPRTKSPLINLENDFKAGLDDHEPAIVLKSICWLGRLRHLQSTTELHALLNTADPLERAYLWETLLSVGDVSVIQEIANHFDRIPPVSRPFYLPQDRIRQMELRVFNALCDVRAPAVIPYLEHFAESPDVYVRVNALQGLRKIGSLTSARVFLQALDESREDIGFIAMQSLIELAGGGSFDWVPRYEEFLGAPNFYAAQCRQWWKAEGKARARARAGLRLDFRIQ